MRRPRSPVIREIWWLGFFIMIVKILITNCMAKSINQKKRERRFKCMDCKINTLHIGEYYMLKDRVCNQIHNNQEGMLCIGCAEARLKRRLNSKDFNDCFLNRHNPCGTKSMRLTQRLKA